MFSFEQFREMARCSQDTAYLWYQPTMEAFAKWEVNTKKRIAFHMAQTAHECSNYTVFVENLNYGAQGLADTWPTKFAEVPKARPRSPNKLAWAVNRQPEKIANIVYAGRFGNGDEASGDGWKYRGQGPIQITFQSNFADCGAAIGMNLIDHPELLQQPKGGALSAGWYMNTRGCYELIDSDNFQDGTKKINVALLHLEERWARYTSNISILGRA